MKPTINCNYFTKSIQTNTILLYIVNYNKLMIILPRVRYSYDSIQLYFSAAVNEYKQAM